MKVYNSFISALLIGLIALFCTTKSSYAQGRGNKTDNEYYRLAWRALQPQSFIQHQVLPSKGSSSSALVGFSLSYDLLQFKKSESGYSSQILISLDVFKTTEEEAKKIDELEKKELEQAERDRKRGRRPNLNVLREQQLAKLEELIPVNTLVYRDTLFVDTYEATTSRAKQFTGNFLLDLEPGTYRYRIELRQNDDPTAQQSSFRTLRIRDAKTATSSFSLLVGEYNSDDHVFVSNNLDGKIPFGKEFDLLLWLPDTLSVDDYQLNLVERGFEPVDSTKTKNLLISKRVTEALRKEPLILSRTVSSNNNQTEITLTPDGFQQYIIRINGIDLPNSRFSVELSSDNDSDTKPIYKSMVSSYWADMPLALFNVELAIEMLRFIVPENTIKELNRGSNEQKITAFERFWKEKDPTPETDFNELMTEYYRRIDFAFENYSSPSTPGFENDMGQYYIKLGPPTEKKRTLLGNNQTMVQWFYPQIELVFQSTSGFGDYQLIERKTR